MNASSSIAELVGEKEREKEKLRGGVHIVCVCVCMFIWMLIQREPRATHSSPARAFVTSDKDCINYEIDKEPEKTEVRRRNETTHFAFQNPRAIPGR